MAFARVPNRPAKSTRWPQFSRYCFLMFYFWAMLKRTSQMSGLITLRGKVDDDAFVRKESGLLSSNQWYPTESKVVYYNRPALWAAAVVYYNRLALWAAAVDHEGKERDWWNDILKFTLLVTSFIEPSVETINVKPEHRLDDIITDVYWKWKTLRLFKFGGRPLPAYLACLVALGQHAVLGFFATKFGLIQSLLPESS